MRRTAPLLACLASAAALAAAPRPLTPPEDAVMRLQIALDRRGFSCNTIDADGGRKTQVALATYCAVQGLDAPGPLTPGSARALLARLFPRERAPLVSLTVTAADRAALVALPRAPAEKAKLAAMGYETIEEMFAERGHCSRTLLRRLNPTAAWPNPEVGATLTVPAPSRYFDRPAPRRWPYGRADVLRVSLARREVTAFDAEGRMIGLFPCSIAANKNKLPPTGEIFVKTLVEDPNYTYTAPRVGRHGRITRLIFPPGPNNPVGAAWIGLTLPTYGIHGTPFPEQIGRAESHGCFRLANWNAQILHSMCDIGTNVCIEN